MGEHQPQIAVRPRLLEMHRRGEAAIERQDRPLGQRKLKALPGLGQFQHARGPNRAPIRAQKPIGHGHMERCFVGLPCGGRGRLGQGQGIGAVGIVFGHIDLWCSGLRIPQGKLAQIPPGRILENRKPMLDRAGLAIMAGEIEGQRIVIGLLPDKRMQHADHLGALFIDRRGIEIVDLGIFRRADRMRQWPGIFAELPPAQRLYIDDPLHGGGSHIGRKLLIPENRQPLFQRKLKPVTAGDAVAGPVVEIFVGDDPLDLGIIGIGGGFRAGQDIFGIKDIQALVFHRPGIEIIHRHDHEQIQIIFPAIDLFIPAHRPFQCIHGIGGAGLIPGAHIDPQGDIPARSGCEMIADMRQITSDEGKKITGLGMRIMPFDKARPIRNQIAIRQHHRRGALDPHGIGRHHIRAIGEIGDLAKPFRLALGAIHPVGHIKPLKRGIGRWIDLGLAFQFKPALGQMAGGNGQIRRADSVIRIRNGHAINL